MYDSDNTWEDTEEKVFCYDSLLQIKENFNARYGIVFEELDVSKGLKFFNINLYT